MEPERPRMEAGEMKMEEWPVTATMMAVQCNKLMDFFSCGCPFLAAFSTTTADPEPSGGVDPPADSPDLAPDSALAGPLSSMDETPELLLLPSESAEGALTAAGTAPPEEGSVSGSRTKAGLCRPNDESAISTASAPELCGR